MLKKTRLRIFKIVSSIFTTIVVILFILAVHSSFLDPLMNQEMFIELPSEDDIIWSFEDDTLLAETSLTMENNGFYSMQDIEIRYDLFGLDRELFSDTIRVDSLSTGERREIPVSMAIQIDDFEDEVIEDLVFNETDLEVRSHLTARYPFSLMNLDLRYDEILRWDGLVQILEFEYQEASVSSLPDQDGSILSIPYEVETNELLEGDADVDITMYDETMTTVYSTHQITVPLGQRHREDLTFELDESLTEEFITNSQRVKFVSDITFSGAEMSFEYTTEHDWGAPLNDISIENVQHTLNQVRGDLTFDNDSPRFLQLDINIRVFDADDQLVGTQDESFNVASGQSVDRTIEVEVVGDPVYAEVTFYEHDTEMEHRMEVDVDV